MVMFLSTHPNLLIRRGRGEATAKTVELNVQDQVFGLVAIYRSGTGCCSTSSATGSRMDRLNHSNKALTLGS